jgi:hypothetical protein
VTRTDVIGLDEVVQKLQVRRLKGLILTIGPRSQGHSEQESVYRIISEPQNLLNPHHFEKNIEQTLFRFYNF